MDRIHPLSRRTALIVLLLSVGALGESCATRNRYIRVSQSRAASPAAATTPVSAVSKAPADASSPGPTFEATVRPILAVRCAPCHNPGGQMYDRLPFDQPGVISSHADGVRRRLKEEDLRALEEWLATLPPSPKS